MKTTEQSFRAGKSSKRERERQTHRQTDRRERQVSKQKEAVKGPLPGRRLLLPRGVRRWPSPVLVPLQRGGHSGSQSLPQGSAASSLRPGPGLSLASARGPAAFTGGCAHRRTQDHPHPWKEQLEDLGSTFPAEVHLPDREKRAPIWGSTTQARRVSRALPAPAACAAGGGALGACASLVASTAWEKRCGCCGHAWKRREYRAG